MRLHNGHISIQILIFALTDLALTVSNGQQSQAFHVLFILTILGATILFCHSLINLCLVALLRAKEKARPCMSTTGSEGFACPTHPIRVGLARDEEAAGIDSEVTKFPPPVYGLWRGSVVSFVHSHESTSNNTDTPAAG